MLEIKNLSAKLAESDKAILDKVSLKVGPGETHLLQGSNGSGKSTLVAVLSGDPKFVMTGGKIVLDGQDLTKALPHERSLAGLFVAYQYPLAIPGLDMSNFLRLAYNQRQEKPMPVFSFRKLLRERAQLINYPEHLLERHLNDGFSGGEKKKTEILQLALLEPKYAILDETDSGLDQGAIADVFTGLKTLRETLLPDLALIIITHYEKVLSYLDVDFVHEMKAGRIVKQK